MNTSHVWFGASCSDAVVVDDDDDDDDDHDDDVHDDDVANAINAVSPLSTLHPRHLQAEHHPSSIEKRSLCSRTSTTVIQKRFLDLKFHENFNQKHRKVIGLLLQIDLYFLTASIQRFLDKTALESLGKVCYFLIDLKGCSDYGLAGISDLLHDRFHNLSLALGKRDV